jgi:outer membrane usher protein
MCTSHRRRFFAAFLAICAALFTFSAANAAATGGATGTASSSASAITGDVDDARLQQLQSNQTLELAVVVNGSPTGKIGEFVARGNSLFARSEELSRLGFLLPDPPGANGLVLLTGINGLTTRIDQGSQTLYVLASPRFIAPTIIGEPSRDDYAIESGAGAVLNYDIVGTSADGKRAASGLFDARAFSRYGVVSSGLLVNSSPQNSGHEGQSVSAVRLDSTYVYSDPRSLRRYRFGDFITGGLPWTRPVRLGGAQVNSDFSMRPDLITFPVPQISGLAAVPSTVDVLVNGSRVVSGDIPAGPFNVPQVPVVSGGGTVTTTITDAVGRQVVTQLPFYASAALLAPKLQTYSAEVGFVRRNWGVRSNDYGSAAGLITYRRGISSFLTLETHAEATERLKMAGIGAVVNLGNFALLNVAGGGSHFYGRSGGQVSAGIQRLTPIYSLGGSITVANRRFGDIAAANGDPVSTFQLNANASVSLRSFGSLGIAYTEVRRAALPKDPRNAPFANALDFAEPEHSRILTASYSRQFGRVAAYATVFRDFGEKKGTQVMVGLTLPLGRRTTASVSAQGSSGAHSGQVEVDRAAIVPGDWGFRAFASASGGGDRAMSGHEFAQATYKSGFGQVFAGVDHTAGHTVVQAEMRGAVALADGGLFASNRIDDSFAIVDTGTPRMRVLQENREVGRTDSHGRILVPDLRSFEINQLSIEPLDAPVDAEVTVTRKTVRPQDRSGVVVKFPVKVEHGALLRLVDRSGKPLPVGSSATLASSGAAVPIGYDGEAYVVDLSKRNQVLVDLPDGGKCAVSFDFKPAANQIPTIGPLPCRETMQ